MIYLNNAATTRSKPKQVLNAVEDFLKELNVSPGRGTDKDSIAADKILSDTRKLLAKLFNAGNPDNIVFTLNCSDAINTALKGILKSGDHVIISPIEHNSIVRPIRFLEKSGVETSIVETDDENGITDPKELQKYLKKNTRMIACLHASNVTGAIQPIKEIGGFAKNHNLLFLVDAAQTAGAYEIDVKDSNIDLLAFAGHKSLMGPQGTGGLVIGENVKAQNIAPLRHGGTGSLSEMETQPEIMPDKFETGTPNTPGIAGLKEAVKFILDKGVNNIQKHGEKLLKQLLDGLSEIDGLTIYGPKDPKFQIPVVSFNIEGMEPLKAGKLLEEKFGIIVRTGLHCSPLCHKKIGTFPKGTVRISTGYYNTSTEIEKAIRAINKIAT